MASSPTRPEVAILCHSPALNALKRPQLVALAKEFGLKASGKNVELIERLKHHGQELARKPRASTTPPDQEAGEETSWMVIDEEENKTKAEVPNSKQDMDVEKGMQEFGVEAEPGDKSTIPTSFSNSSLASTIRSVGGSLLRKLKSTTNLQKSSSQSSLAKLETPSGTTEVEPPSHTSPFRPSTPKIYPSLTPQSIASYSPFALGARDHAMSEVTPDTQSDQPDSSFSTLSTMASSSCASSFQHGTGIRLVSRPTDYGASASSTTLPLVAANSIASTETAEPSIVSDCERDYAFVSIPQGTTHVTTLAPVSPELSKPPTNDARFIFGSPVPKAKSDFTFSLSPGPSIEPLLAPATIMKLEPSPIVAPTEGVVRSKSTTELVMEEMNRRALESLAQSSTLNQSITSLSHSTSTHQLASGSDAKGNNKRMFDASHRKVFDRMQGIDTHYAAKRPREAMRNNNTLSTSTSTGIFRSTSSKSLFHKGDDEDDVSRSNKKPKLASSALSHSIGSKRLFGTASSTVGSNPMKQSPEKVASALREQGWLGVSGANRSGTTSGASSLGNLSKNGKKEQSSEEREEVKRRLGMLKHQRRKSQAQQASRMRKKRVSLGPTPKPSGSLTKTLFRATFGSKSSTNEVPPVPSSVSRPPPVPVVPSVLARSTTTNDLRASTSSLSRPKPAHAAPSIGMTRPKFDLQASLKRKPVGYTPKLGPLSASEPLTHKLESPATTRPFSSSLSAPTLASSSKQLPPSTRILGSSAKANVASLQTNSPAVVRKAGTLRGKLGGRIQGSLAGRGGAFGSTSARAAATAVALPKVE
ncbi:BZ3500_MvSof-1268-A1-R1_Chr2-3g05373 [Microbotryum saponariae]|uniref:BZ3500_MvSof-1268-A1-R1_Chr2-3g05373 protein n=1 Tax=Microbotryum saponariae TaxID=289078 RepID=A0A2X0N7X6_9BASI|nr:BZ3500_MvSof-1268-A1-R1_Chr2-3g05373 [Microbotryum saponariae]SDA01306.1 BZ3501_MvSof-1269-A2-R1_Chr2-2g05046 [Microbotryum saponariae]